MGLFRDPETERFGQELAAELGRRYPAARMSQAEASKREQAMAKALEHVALAARSFKRDHSVGMLKQIGLSKTFQQKLNELGYEEDFIKAATLRLAQAIGTK
jgi:hypothetical protein